MLYFPVPHINIPMGKIYSLWQNTYLSEHQARPRKNTVSVRKEDLKVFVDEPWIVGRALRPVSAFFGVTPARLIMNPHRDPSSDPAVVERGYDYHPWAINIPLTCDVGSRMCWHRVRPGSVSKLEGAGHSPYNNVRVPMADMEDLQEIGSVCLDRPMLVNTFEWHSVANDTDETRLIFSLRFEPIVSVPEAAALFSAKLL